MKHVALSFTLLALAVASAQATSYTWDAGGANQNWRTVGNWDPESPTPVWASDTFLIGSGFTAVTDGGGSYFNGALTLEGQLNVNDNWVAAQNLILNGGTLANVRTDETQIYNTAGQISVNDADAGEGVTTSYLHVANASGTLRLNTKVNAGVGGSGNLQKTGSGLLILNGAQTGGTWAGTMTINGGRVRLENSTTFLGSGSLEVDADELDLSSFNSGTVKVLTGGVATNTNNAGRTSTLRLQGGTLQGYNNWNIGDGGSTSKIYVDNDSTLKGSVANQYMYIYAQLNGAGNLNVVGPGLVGLNNNLAGNTYSGIITIAEGGTLRMANRLGLSGGTINVENATGLMYVGDGFTSGTVNIKTNGILENDNNNAPVYNLHLQGGTVRGYNNWSIGDGTANSKIYVDNASTLQGKVAGQYMYISAQLNGSGGLNVTGPGWVGLNYGLAASTYAGGIITVAPDGHLRMNNQYGLAGGTISLDGTSGQFQLGSGFLNGKVEVNTGGVAEADNTGDGAPAYALYLKGGTLRGVTNNARVGNNSTNSKIYVDSASTIGTSAAVTSGNWLYIRSQFNGSADLNITSATSGAGVMLGYNALSTTYTGTISVDGSSKLRMENANGLSGGTISLGTGSGLFQLGEGFANGKVVAAAGGIVEADLTDWRQAAQLRLDGGTLRAYNGAATYYAGHYNTNSKLYVDSASSITAPNASGALTIGAQLQGAGGLTVNGPGWVNLQNNVAGSTYSGTIQLAANGNLRMNHANALSGGTILLTQGLFRLGEGWATGKVIVDDGGVAEADLSDWRNAVELRLDGGTLRSYNGNADYYVGTYNSTSKLYVDSTSTLQGSYAGRYLHIGSQLNGSGDLNVTGPGWVQLNNTVAGTTYSGTIGIAAGGSLRIGQNAGLSGGTIEVDNPTGLLRLGEGFATGRVLVQTGGVAEADHGSDRIAKELRLQGGTLRSLDGAADYRVGDNSANSMIYVDNASTIQATRSGYSFWLSSKITGSETITKTGAGQLYFNGISNNAATFTGDWDIQQGYLTLSNPSGGTWKGENLGSGATVNIAGGAYLRFTDNNSNNRWELTKNLAGTGTVQLTETSDRIIITRNAANTFGGISPGNSAGTLTFNWTVAPNTNAQLDFAKNASGDRAVWYVEAVDATSYDKVVSNGYLGAIANAKLVVDPTKPIAEAMTIYQGIASQNLSTLAFGEVSWMYDTTGTVNYNTDGTITLTNILPVLWSTASGSWNVTGNWDRLLPTSNTMAGVWNGGVSEVNTAQDVLCLTVQNADSRVNIVSAGSLNAGRSVEVRSGGTMSIDGAMTTPLFNSVGTTNLNAGATGSIATLNVSGGTTTIKTGSGFGYTNVNVIGGSSAGGNLAVDDATVDVTAMVVGTTDQTAATATITDSTVTAGSVAVRRSNSALAPSLLTVASGGELVLADTAAYIADVGSYDTGRYVLSAGGKIHFTSEIDLATFHAQTEWNGGVLVVDGTLTNYHNRNLAAGQIVDFGSTGDLASGSANRLYLRGGEIRFGDGYVRDTRLQMTEDLGTIVVSGGALSSMPGTISASVTLQGALATWNTGNATLGSGTVLALVDGAKATVGVGKFLNVDQVAFGGTGGTVELAGGYLIHGAAELAMGAGALITGNGQVLVGSAGIDLGSTGDEGSLLGTGAGLVVYGDIRGNGSVVNTTVYGNVSVGHSPGVMTMDDTTLSGSSILAMELGGTDQSLYDQVVLPGLLTVQSGATLDVSWYDGFEGSLGDTFTLFSLAGGSISGTFDVILPTFSDPGLNWNTSALYSSGTISVVPEPATMALLSIGGLLILARRRGRREHE
ncbi:MAG: PEP-CTERM sorting domain-containing protein [Planctomycetaceae bacterium]|nr:PEP-CTERM sorting domain-containing protein [Planctomycetaceae bacterium]